MSLKRKVQFSPVVATIGCFGVKSDPRAEQEEDDVATHGGWSTRATAQVDSSLQWYSEQEIDLLAKDALLTARYYAALRSQREERRRRLSVQKMKDQQERQKTRPMNTGSSGDRYQDSFSKGPTRTKRNDHDGSLRNKRGLELLTDPDATITKQRQAVIAQFPGCVLREQTRQRRRGVSSQERIAQASVIYSHFSAVCATNLGLVDEHDALLDYRTGVVPTTNKQSVFAAVMVGE